MTSDAKGVVRSARDEFAALIVVEATVPRYSSSQLSSPSLLHGTSTELIEEPRFREIPIALHGRDRDLEGRRRFTFA
jgi:hypothetical protein